MLEANCEQTSTAGHSVEKTESPNHLSSASHAPGWDPITPTSVDRKDAVPVSEQPPQPSGSRAGRPTTSILFRLRNSGREDRAAAGVLDDDYRRQTVVGRRRNLVNPRAPGPPSKPN